MAGLKPFDLAAARGAGMTNALNMQKFQQNALSPGGGGAIEFGKVNPRDFTPESMEIFRQSQNFNDLNRYERFRTGKINGALHLIDVQGEQPPIPLSTTQSESEANRQLAYGTKQGGLEAGIKYQPEIDLQEISQAQSLKGVDLKFDPQIKKKEAIATEVGRHEGKLQTGQTKRLVGAQAESEKTARLKTLITKAKTQATKWTTGFLGEKLKGVAGSPAHNLSQTLLTLQANAGFDRLQEMRNASVAGGALGQVSERELALLMASYAAIGQSQSREQFIENLDAFEKQVNQSWARVEMAYELDYGEKYTGQAMEPQEVAPNEEAETVDDRAKRLLGL